MFFCVLIASHGSRSADSALVSVLKQSSYTLAGPTYSNTLLFASATEPFVR